MSEAENVENTGAETTAQEEECNATFTPLVDLNQLPEVEVKSYEENENVLSKFKVKMFRYDLEAKEWKERGFGDLKFLQDKENKGKIRILMRRDKTLKICANHYIFPEMILKENVGSDRSWVYTTPADFSEEEAKPEMLAVRFQTSDIAKEFKAKFDEYKKIVEEHSEKKE
jgi:Ran-binding protein 1